ncbi:alpha/beta-hydrolase [Aaosphaeria arxii CBS 175.79]|uniref:Alpha/beta-hydrolase n=1 Tax=Aaosphaeria arxii CBS 175.79 TaxID=1450172 RepID=A0A6A5Y7J7_9PLEO|nr:alpha/beta-hydrolase [Aaosphaeria arxii CBS 175.79]KAF2020524.1 alpha/beta-hydrolase [Aaosphaeria arxii CBS 175.79]
MKLPTRGPVVLSTLLYLLIHLAPSSAQFVSPPTDLITKTGYAGVDVRYKQVPPGICELDPNVKSFSGYADVEEDQHIFWWFFEARNQDPSTAPLTVWINGGPGSSSMVGLFEELGPCSIDINGEVVNNPYSWTNASNMLFIDQPTTTGFSYSVPIPAYKDAGYTIQLPNNTCPDYAEEFGTCGTWSRPFHTMTANSTHNGAPAMWKTLQGFMGAFPEYSRSGFNFATESYGGHYAPIYNAYIVEQNAKDIPGAHKIQLENVLIGNGWLDPLVQFPSYYEFMVEPGNTYDFDPFNASVKAQLYNAVYGEGNCIDQLQLCAETGQNSVCSRADNFCLDKVQLYIDELTGRDDLDFRYLLPLRFPYRFYVPYLNRADVQAAIGAYQNYSTQSPTVASAFDNTGDDGREAGTLEACRTLLESGVQVMLYYGDTDVNCNWMGGQAAAAKVAAPGYESAGFVNLTTSDGIVHGQVRQSGLFSFLRIYEAGHEVPFYQPLASLEIFKRALARLDIATGLVKIEGENLGYRTVGCPTSDYREGNGTVQWEVTPKNATYNTKLNAPDLVPTWAPAASSSSPPPAV